MADPTDIRELLVEGIESRVTVTPELAGDHDALREAVAAAGSRPMVTAFGVLETLDDHVALVETLVALVEGGEATAIFDVPDHGTDAEPPSGKPVFTAGSVEELRSILPSDHVVLHEVPLRGAAIIAADAGSEDRTVTITLAPGAPQRVLLAFGPSASSLSTVAAATQFDPKSELARRRGLEADAALVTTLLAERRT